MSAPIARGFSTAARLAAKAENPVSKGARMDPELYGIMAATCATVGFAGYYLGANPTSGTDEAHVTTAPNSKPWEQPTPSDSKADFKYQYHPGGNTANPPRDAPSALHSVIIPNVDLPKHLHDKYNKYGKDGY